MRAMRPVSSSEWYLPWNDLAVRRVFPLVGWRSDCAPVLGFEVVSHRFEHPWPDPGHQTTAMSHEQSF